MALLSVELEQLGTSIHEDKEQALFEKLRRQVKDISADIHRLSYQLHPSKLDHLGLSAALKSLCGEIADNSKIRIGCHQTGFPSILSKDLELCLFRVAQEALRNSVRHSGARSIQVVLARSSNSVRLSVSDNGSGFEIQPETMEKGLGFISMRERLYAVNGEMNVFSRPGRGTRIEVSVPLEPE
jgi:signal transduction histidine kinase